MQQIKLQDVVAAKDDLFMCFVQQMPQKVVVAAIFSWWLDDTGSHNRAAHMSVISSKEA